MSIAGFTYQLVRRRVIRCVLLLRNKPTTYLRSIFPAAVWLGLLSVFFLSMVGTFSRPPGAIAPYLNGVFPDVTPGAGGSWYLEEVLSEIDIAAPVKIVDFPGTEDVLILCKTGKLWRVNLAMQTQVLVLDVADRTVNFSEGGAVSLALHPEFGNSRFPDKQSVFLFYRYKPDARVDDHPGYNRLSKFAWDTAQQRFAGDAEEILIQQYDRNVWHNGGGLFFADGLLYLALGDEGGLENRAESNQRLDGGLFSGLMRIDVDNDPTRSHPIRRQPMGNADPPAGWTDTTFTRGYSIPNDNPWLNEDGSILEEYFAIGIRSPYSTYYDTVDRTIWLADVGTSTREEINRVDKGDNLQWPFLEGDQWTSHRPDSLLGNERSPVFQYGNDLGKCIIGGGVYRGSKFLSLNGHYVFGDYVSNKIMVLREVPNENAKAEVLLSDLGPEALDLPQFSSISGVHLRPDGEILVTTIAWPYKSGGHILHLRQRDAVPDPPTRLSELGVFTNLDKLEVSPGIFPYNVNAPLWSDRAEKRRWMAVPNDGTFDEPGEQIRFSATEDWAFPEGTVFIKHFDLPTGDGERTKLETRFFVMAKNRTAYGLTYRWNDEQTDAILQRESTDATYTIYEDGRANDRQRWTFPGRDQCMSCHNANANYVLGVKTHQLNSELSYPGGGVQNQLGYLSDHGIIDHRTGDMSAYPKAYPLDGPTKSLGVKIQSYLDANCASCHRVGGVTGVTMDLRFSTPLYLKNLINLPTRSQSSGHQNLLVEPGFHARSELWIRDQSREANRMPPIGSNLVDEAYVAALAEWIDGLAAEEDAIKTFVAFPNPTSGWMMLRANRDWLPPLTVEVFSADGKLVHTEVHSEYDFDLNLHRAGAGAFIMSVRDAAGQIGTQRVLIH